MTVYYHSVCIDSSVTSSSCKKHSPDVFCGGRVLRMTDSVILNPTIFWG
ncbi:MAG: hypothetical protein ACI37T_01820 [Candidatus Gastranaerophilaceae bacterium]